MPLTCFIYMYLQIPSGPNHDTVDRGPSIILRLGYSPASQSVITHTQSDALRKRLYEKNTFRKPQISPNFPKQVQCEILEAEGLNLHTIWFNIPPKLIHRLFIHILAHSTDTYVCPKLPVVADFCVLLPLPCFAEFR